MLHPSAPAWISTVRALLLANHVRALRMGCSFIANERLEIWHAVVEDPRRFTVVQAELRMGLESTRADYNRACWTVVQKTGQPHLGHRSGFADLFVPVLAAGRLEGVLVCGPFATEHATVRSLRRCWQDLSGTVARPDDTEFLRFVRAALDTHVFQGPALLGLRALFERFASAVAGEVDRAAWEKSKKRGFLHRYVAEARMWAIASDLVDVERNAVWLATSKQGDRRIEGLSPIPNIVMAIVPTDRGRAIELDERLVRADRLQRGCAMYAARLPGRFAGRLGDQGALLLAHVPAARAMRVAQEALRYVKLDLGIDAVCGVSQCAAHPGELPRRRDEALWAAMSGLSQGESLTLYIDAPEPLDDPCAQLYRSTRVLHETFASGRAHGLDACAQEAMRAVHRLTGSSLDAVRSHALAIILDLVAIAERQRLAGKRMASRTIAGITWRTRRAATLEQIEASFARAVRDLFDVVHRPDALDRASLERVRQMAEQVGPHPPIDTRAAAKYAGLSVSQFARAFRRAYGQSFSRLVTTCRIDRSKELLRDTLLSVTAISREAGFSSASHFHQVFRRVVGSTPEQYRSAR